MQNYIYKNVNPVKNITDDCVIRAISLATNKEWRDIFSLLTQKAYNLYSLPNNQDVYKSYLNEIGNYIKIPVKKGTPRISALYFAKTHKSGRYVLRLANHLTCCINGILYDTWDCSGKSVYCAWEIK